MKKLITLLLLTTALLYTMSCGAQQTLNSDAKALKEKMPEYYIPIRNAAIEKWDYKHDTILYEINRQSKAFVAIVNFVNSPAYADQENQNMFVKLMSTWTAGKQDWTISDQGDPFTWKIDWVMLDFDLNNNLKAKTEY